MHVTPSVVDSLARWVLGLSPAHRGQTTWSKSNLPLMGFLPQSEGGHVNWVWTVECFVSTSLLLPGLIIPLILLFSLLLFLFLLALLLQLLLWVSSLSSCLIFQASLLLPLGLPASCPRCLVSSVSCSWICADHLLLQLLTLSVLLFLASHCSQAAPCWLPLRALLPPGLSVHQPSLLSP